MITARMTKVAVDALAAEKLRQKTGAVVDMPLLEFNERKRGDLVNQAMAVLEALKKAGMLK